MARPDDIPDSPYGESAVAWIRSAGGPPAPALMASARQALQRVQAEGSELAELWDESEGDAWRADLQRLDAALTPPP
jgi:hypothetical protein